MSVWIVLGAVVGLACGLIARFANATAAAAVGAVSSVLGFVGYDTVLKGFDSSIGGGRCTYYLDDARQAECLQDAVDRLGAFGAFLAAGLVVGFVVWILVTVAFPPDPPTVPAS